MKHICNCNPCTCTALRGDAANSVAIDRARETIEPAAPSPDSAVTQTLLFEGAAQRRGAFCKRLGETAEPGIGAHLITPRRGYTHHGIYAGHGSVLHYAGLAHALRPAPVEEVSLERFAGGKPVYTECRSAPALSEREIVARARSRLGENRYRLLTNNCEHFSEWSRFGTSRSPQIERWIGRTPAVTRGFIDWLGRALARLRPLRRAESALV